MLRIDDLAERGMRIGIGATANPELAIEKRNARAGTGECLGGCEPGNTCANNENVRSRRAHPKILAARDWSRPGARMASFCGVGTEMRSRKTAVGETAMRSSR